MGYNFQTDKKYNFEKYVSLSIDMNKTCYSKGEIISGNIILLPKNGIKETQLRNPYAIITLEEKQYYEYNEYYYDHNRKGTYSRTKSEEENRDILSIQIDYSNFDGANILIGVNCPFQIRVPETAYPSMFFSNNEFIKHFIICDFPSIEARKTCLIIIKNNLYFSKFNGLLQAPVLYDKKIIKHKYAIFNSGYFYVKVTVPKNFFDYNENIPFVIDIDCGNLSINIKSLKISIYRNQNKNYQKNHKNIRSKQSKEIIGKTIKLAEGEKIYHLEDNIKLPVFPVELNPKEVYLILDNDKREYKEKFKNIKLFPSCYGGLLSCEYYLNIIFEMDTWFSTNEKIIIPLDLYERFNFINNNTQAFLPQHDLNNNSNQSQPNNCCDDCDNSQQAAPIIFPLPNSISQINYKSMNIDNNPVFNINSKEEVDNLPTEEELLAHKKSKEDNINNDNENHIKDDKDDLYFNLLK